MERVVPEDGCSWTERRALAKAWDALAPAASGLSLSGGGDLELSEPLRGLHWPEVVGLNESDRQTMRSYSMMSAETQIVTTIFGLRSAHLRRTPGTL